MKRIIQLILFLTLLLISFIFHKLYFQGDDKTEIQTNINSLITRYKSLCPAEKKTKGKRMIIKDNIDQRISKGMIIDMLFRL